jgi:hypothetical protein
MAPTQICWTGQCPLFLNQQQALLLRPWRAISIQGARLKSIRPGPDPDSTREAFNCIFALVVSSSTTSLDLETWPAFWRRGHPQQPGPSCEAPTGEVRALAMPRLVSDVAPGIEGPAFGGDTKLDVVPHCTRPLTILSSFCRRGPAAS